MGQEKITAKQIRIIKMAQRDLGIEDDAYRDLLLEQFGVDSCTRLSLEQANRLIDDLQKKGFHLKAKSGWRQARPAARRPPRPAGTPRNSGNLVALASPQEIEKVNAVAALIPWRFEDGLQRFLAARVGIKGGKIRTAAEAYQAIEALKKMFENGMKKERGPDWWAIPFEDPAVEEYINRHAPAEFRSPVTGKVYKRGGA